MTCPPEWPFSHYIHSHSLEAEMWTTMKNCLLGKKFLCCSFYLYRFCKYVSYGFPIINFCNPGVHYEMPWMSLRFIVTLDFWWWLKPKPSVCVLLAQGNVFFPIHFKVCFFFYSNAAEALNNITSVSGCTVCVFSDCHCQCVAIFALVGMLL